MKKSIFIIIALAAVTAGTAFSILSDNGKAGYTGSSGEPTCISCHNTYPVSNGGPGYITITSNLVNGNQYIPGQTYTIHTKVRQIGKSLFGIGVEALTVSKQNAGTFVITNAATQIKTKTVSGVVRNNVVHQFNGGAHPDSMDFVFDWIAPSTNVGDVTFSAAGIAADNSGDESGDYVYNETKVVSAGSAMAVGEINDNSTLSVKVFPNQHLLSIDYKTENLEDIIIFIHDMNGHQISKTVNGIVAGGLHHDEINLPYSMSAGIYLVTLQSGSKKLTKKISVMF